MYFFSISPILRCCPVKSAIFISFLMMHATDTLSIHRRTHTNILTHIHYTYAALSQSAIYSIQSGANVCCTLLTLPLILYLHTRLSLCANHCGRFKCCWSVNFKRVAHSALLLSPRSLAFQFVSVFTLVYSFKLLA